MSDKPASKPTEKTAASEALDDQGMYDLADDPDEQPALKPARPAPPGSTGSAKGAAAGAAMPTGARKAMPSGARKMPATPPKRPGQARSAMEGGAVLAAARGGPRRNQDADRQAAFDVAKKIGLFVGAIVVLIGIVIGVKMLAGDEAPDVGDDKEAKSLISDHYYDEIRQWLEEGQQGRTLVGHSPSQTAALVDDLYGKGAKTLLAGGKLQSMHMVIELPEDEAARGALIEWANQWHAKYQMFDRTERKDEGQRYLIAQMPLNR